MNVGMMWFDKSNVTLDEQIRRAVMYYRTKYDASPNVCLVHRGCLAQLNVSEMQIENVTVREFRGVLPYHFWLGVEKAGE